MTKRGLDQVIDGWLEKPAEWLEKRIFFEMPFFGGEVIPIVLLVLAGTAIFLTLYFKFINVRELPLAIRTVKGKYSSPNDPGEITHFQALTAALSATVGLGNIAGVAVAVGIGGPGATFWMILMGICGMTTKFCECTLGVKYRRIDKDGKVSGGAMYYLQDGFKEKGLGGVGKFLAIFFAVFCIGAAMGAGNMYQANQAHSQFVTSFGSAFDIGIWNNGYVFGATMAFFVGLVIIGGIVWIARVTSILVPVMCGLYVIAGFVILGSHIGDILPAFGQIIGGAFSNEAMTGGFVGVLIQGIRRAAFSNEAGIGSAPIAHAAVKTRKPASEGLVALLEPFTDTVIVCTMTALVIVITGQWKVDAVAREEGLNLFSAQPAVVQMVDSKGRERPINLEKGDAITLLGSMDADGWQEARDVKDGRAGWFNVRTLAAGKKISVSGNTLTSNDSNLSLLKEKPEKLLTLASGDELRLLNKPAASGWQKVVYLKNGKTGWLDINSAKAANEFEMRLDIAKTSAAFGEKIPWFPWVLTVAVMLFAFSTMISWSYYGEQGLIYLMGRRVPSAVLAYKLVFCGFVVIGAAASLSNVLRVSDALLFAMVIPNMIGIYVLLPVVKKEFALYKEHARAIDAGEKEA